MNRYKWIGILVLMITGILTSCFEDKGNYDYDWVQSVALRTELKDTTIQRGTVLKIVPELTKLVGTELVDLNPDDYTYCWEAVWDNNQRLVLSTECDLNDTIWLTIGKTYQINYTVTEKTSEVSWLNRFNMRIVQRYTNGLLFMTEDADKNVELEIYASDTKGDKVHESGVLARSGFPYRKGGANFVASTRVNKNKYLWVATGEGTGWLQLPDFSWDEKQMLQMLLIKEEPEGYTLNNIGQSTAEYLLGFTKEGNTHILNSNYIVYSDIAYVNMQKFKASPYWGGDKDGAILYDNDRKCFVLYTRTNYGWQFPATNCVDVAENAAFAGSTLYCMSLTKDGKTVAFLKDKDGKYWKCKLNIGKNNNTPELVVEEQIELTASIAMLERADCKVIAWENQWAYFTMDHKLYSYRYGSGIDECREVALMDENGGQLTLDGIVSVIVVPNNIQDAICSNIYVTTYSEQNKGKVYVTRPDEAEPLNLIVSEEIHVDGRVKSLCKWSN